jgi:hypothetical protein
MVVKDFVYVHVDFGLIAAILPYRNISAGVFISIGGIVRMYYIFL